MSTLRKVFRSRERQATVTDIRVIVGPLDDSIIEAILNIGATPDEILQAFEWLEENHYTKAIYARSMEDHIRRVYDILDYERSIFNGKSNRH